MIVINNKKIQIVAKIAAEIVNAKTQDELEEMLKHAGDMYEAGELAAQVAVKMFLRILNIEVETRAVSAVDSLIDEGLKTYRTIYAG